MCWWVPQAYTSSGNPSCCSIIPPPPPPTQPLHLLPTFKPKPTLLLPLGSCSSFFPGLTATLDAWATQQMLLLSPLGTIGHRFISSLPGHWEPKFQRCLVRHFCCPSPGPGGGIHPLVWIMMELTPPGRLWRGALSWSWSSRIRFSNSIHFLLLLEQLTTNNPSGLFYSSREMA